MGGEVIGTYITHTVFPASEAMSQTRGALTVVTVSSAYEPGRRPRELGPSDLEREWRVIATQVRRALERAAAAQDVRARFAVERRRSRDAIRERLEQGDVVLVGWGGWSPRAKRSALVRVLHDGTAAADRALEVGVRLSGERGQLSVWLVGAEPPSIDAMRARLEGKVGRLHLAPMSDPSVAAIRHILAERPGGLLVVPSGTEVADQLAERSREARFPAGMLVVH